MSLLNNRFQLPKQLDLFSLEEVGLGGAICSPIPSVFGPIFLNPEVFFSGFPDFCLRHTFPSHMVIRGVSLKEVQRILDYKTKTMTLYSMAILDRNTKKRSIPSVD